MKDDARIFNDLSEDSSQPYTPGETKTLASFYNFLLASEPFEAGQELSSYWQNWDWRTSFFQGEISLVDYENKTVTISIDLPKTLGILSNVPLTCAAENTVSFWQKDLVLQDTNFDVFDSIEADDILYARCMDENCGSIGGDCVIIKRVVRVIRGADEE